MTERVMSLTPPPSGYADWLAELKTRIHSAQQRATVAVNRELVLLYWQIGRDILERQAREGWGAKVIDRLAHDLRTAFPDMKGFSPRNLKYMRSFAEAWPDAEFVQAVLAQLPWYHQLALLDKLNSAEARRWYAAKAIEHNWSRNVLVMQIETNARARFGQAVTQSDFYQLQAYGHSYLDGKGDVILIYPRTDAFQQALPVFEFPKSDGLRLWVLPFCLTSRLLITPEGYSIAVGCLSGSDCKGSA